MPLNPDIDAFLEMANANPTRLHHLGVEEGRQSYDITSEMLDADVDYPYEDLTVAMRDGSDITVRCYSHIDGSAYSENSSENKINVVTQPKTTPVIVFFHGGGYVFGGLDSHNSLCSQIAKYSNALLFAVDYRLAPEHKFPVAFQDACDAYNWITQYVKDLGLDNQPITVMGDSVGGTLAINVSAFAKKTQWRQPNKMVLLYPCTSSTQKTESFKTFAQGYLLEAESLAWMYEQYLPEHKREDWRFAPLLLSDKTNMPETHIVLAENDVLLDEGLQFHEALKASGNSVTCNVYQGMVHDFARFGNIIPETVTELYEEIAGFVQS